MIDVFFPIQNCSMLMIHRDTFRALHDSSQHMPFVETVPDCPIASPCLQQLGNLITSHLTSSVSPCWCINESILSTGTVPDRHISTNSPREFAGTWPANRADKQRPHTLTPSLATAARDPQKAPPRAPHPPKVGHSGARVAPPWHLGSASCWTLIFFLQVRLLLSVLVPLFGLPSLAPSAVCLLRHTQAGGRGN